MKGFWVWPPEPKEQDKILQRILGEDELFTILLALANEPQGLSNAELDRLLANNSQWRTLPHVRALLALGFVQYHVQFFGDAGKYQLTDLGKTIVQRLQASQ
jgi:predicted transcriptional regulator